MFTCPKCGESQFTEVRNLIWHLCKIHCLSDGQNVKIICSYDGCPRTYHNLNSFSKHLHRTDSTVDSTPSTSAVSGQPIHQRGASNSSVEIDDPITDVLEMSSDAIDVESSQENMLILMIAQPHLWHKCMHHQM